MQTYDNPTNSLLSSHVITLAQVEQARQRSELTDQPIVEMLEEVCAWLPEIFVTALGRLFYYPTFDILALHAMKADFNVLPFSFASQYQCLLMVNSEGSYFAIVANPFDMALPDKLDLWVKRPFTLAIAHYQDIHSLLSQHEGSLRAMDGLDVTQSMSDHIDSDIEDISLKTINEDTSAIVKFVRSTLYDALKSGASDIHMETETQGLTIKYRVDGVLMQVGHLSGLAQAEQAISRIKVMAELDIAERRIPQDGRFKVLTSGREVDLRVSIMPSVYGEDAVLRVLDRKALSEASAKLSLDVLGFEPEIMEQFRLLAEEPYGMLLVTGPTGSGKTTTLYGIISEVNLGTDKIITIEDPVEYQLSGILQIPVNEKKGLTFARGLRSILRHDPDKIMVGEIRDGETAQIAVQSALTGHLVLTTVHANNVFDVIGRFTNMGVDPYSFVSAINGILAQRLVRINCTHCLTNDNPSAELIEKSKLGAYPLTSFHFKKGQGCGQCRGTGFKGRKAIAELLIFNDEIRELIATKEPIRKVKEVARENGTRSMREAVLELVRRGETTLLEANRVTSMV